MINLFTACLVMRCLSGVRDGQFPRKDFTPVVEGNDVEENPDTESTPGVSDHTSREDPVAGGGERRDRGRDRTQRVEGQREG